MKNLSDTVLSEENYAYDAAGNITDAPDSCFSYDTNNRLTWYKGDPVSYDQDGNMVSAVLDGTNGTYFTYDSANRLISSGGHTYTYNAEDVRIRNLCSGEDTKYTYNTNCRLSKLLWKDTNGTVTKYVYGRGLIGEETGSSFTTYHFDCRGSTVALTDANGVITDTFEYDTYGKLISRTGTTATIFGYNGRDGVVTDTNGLIYMRARYYSPDMRRFVNADIIHGSISDSTSLNRYAYVNGNPVSFIDPFGLNKEDKDGDSSNLSEDEEIKRIAKELGVSYEHARIIYYSSQWSNHSEFKWTTWDIVEWKLWGGDASLYSKKEGYISNYKDVLTDAAQRYDIPAFLLAGVMYIEFGGAPLWIDDVAYVVRSFDWCGPEWVDENLTITKEPNKTSFGDTSIQVRRALEMFGYSPSNEHINSVISSMKDPVQSIYMAAKHLAVLRDVDFAGKTADQLADEDIQVIASRYNCGPGVSFEVAKEHGYGKDMFGYQEAIVRAMS